MAFSMTSFDNHVLAGDESLLAQAPFLKAVGTAVADALTDALLRNPITGSSCCASTASGQAAAEERDELAPPKANAHLALLCLREKIAQPKP
jgi:hypothetical protein